MGIGAWLEHVNAEVGTGAVSSAACFCVVLETGLMLPEPVPRAAVTIPIYPSSLQKRSQDFHLAYFELLSKNGKLSKGGFYTTTPPALGF